MSTKVAQHSISISMNDRKLAGLIENSLFIKPNFEEVLLHSTDGKLSDELIDFNAEMSMSGLMYVKEAAEALTHYDYVDLRQAVALGAAVTFMHGDITTGSNAVSGQAKIVEYSETAGSKKSAGAWTLRIKAMNGEASIIVGEKSIPVSGYTFDSTEITMDDTTITMDAL